MIDMCFLLGQEQEGLALSGPFRPCMCLVRGRAACFRGVWQQQEGLVSRTPNLMLHILSRHGGRVRAKIIAAATERFPIG